MAWNKGSCTKDDCPYKHETQSHMTRIGRPVRLEVVPLTFWLSRRVKARRYASFGNREDVIEVLIVSSCMRVPLENQGRPHLHSQRAVIPKGRRSLPGVPSVRTRAARFAPRALRTRGLRNPKGRPLVRRHHRLQSVWLHP